MSATYRYFVETRSNRANEFIARVDPQNADALAHRDRLCSDGELRNLWECSWQIFLRVRKEFPRETNGFRQRGGGQIEPWPPLVARTLSKERRMALNKRLHALRRSIATLERRAR